jgi:hypothetical protein
VTGQDWGHIVENWRLLAQSINALADHIDNAIGFQHTPVAFANLTPTPQAGMVACVNDSTVNSWGSVIAGGGTHTVLAFYDGTNWIVAGAREPARGAFRVRLATNQAVPGGVYTLVRLDVVDLDTAGWWNASLNRYTAQVPGFYTFAATCGGSGATAAGVSIVRNGSGAGTNSLNSVFTYSGGKTGTIMPVSMGAYLNGTTDYVELYGDIEQTPTPTITTATFSGARIA